MPSQVQHADGYTVSFADFCRRLCPLVVIVEYVEDKADRVWLIRNKHVWEKSMLVSARLAHKTSNLYDRCHTLTIAPVNDIA